MFSQRTNKHTALALLLTTVFMAGAFTPSGVAHAQSDEEGGGGQSGDGSVSGVGAVIVGCTGLGSAISGAIGSLTSSGSDNVPTNDTRNNQKEGCEDAIASMIASTMLQMLTESIINWINSGFEGDPLFVENPEAFFGDIANEISGQFIAELGISGICEPFRPQITIALASQESFFERSQCTLLDAVDNIDAFINDFGNGGWQGWLALTQQQQNNPYSAYFMAVDEHNRRLARGDQNARGQAQWADGFWPLRECVEYGEVPGPISQGPGASPGALEDQRPCIRYETRTPGQLIAGQGNFSLTIDGRKLLEADEINEALGRVLDTLINQLITTGFRSLTNEDGESSWIEHESDKEEIIEGITQVKEDAVRYIENRRSAIEIMQATRAVMLETRQCYAELRNYSRVSSIIERQQAIIADEQKYEQDAANVESKLPQLDEFIERVNESESGIQAVRLLGEYTNISSNFPSEENLIQAERDLQQRRAELAQAESARDACITEKGSEPFVQPVHVENWPEGEAPEGGGGPGAP